jgi:glyoxylase-like metal-dependent hydrolase (beta-lactamase superfamily II)
MPSLTLGDWRAHTLESGFFALDGGAMFGTVPKTIWSRTNPADERNRIRLGLRVLLLEGHGRRILVDAGVGHKFDAKYTDIYGVDHSRHTLEGGLAAHGMGVEDVTDCVLTHLHFDHAGGSTKREGDRLLPRLPRARYYVQRANLDNALRPNLRERASYLPENFAPLQEAGVLELWDGPRSPWPGVSVWTADGHTRGQQFVRIEGGGQVLCYVADLIPTATHVRIPFVMGYDVEPLRTMEEKSAFLARACDEGAWVCLEHDPTVALARPVRKEPDFAWADTVAAELGAAEPAGR